jgi:menaquinol-cytochrome c reductase iron-sulfur subunit
MAEHEVSRRGFLGWAAGVLAGLGTLFVGVPLVGSVVASGQTATREGFVAVGDVTGVKAGVPTAFPFVDQVRDAYIQERVPRMVWAVKRAGGEVVTYSPVCPHLGCEYFWDPGSSKFVCPCHDSTWNVEGQRLSGPTPRNLDALPSQVKDGMLLVRWEQFRTGTAEQIRIG